MNKTLLEIVFILIFIAIFLYYTIKATMRIKNIQKKKITQLLNFTYKVPLFRSECPICCQITGSALGYTGSMCKECKSVYSSEDWMGSIAMKRRHLLGLTRNEMSNLTGYSRGTIKNYEWTSCSKNYFDKTTLIMKTFFKKIRRPNEEKKL